MAWRWGGDGSDARGRRAALALLVVTVAGAAHVWASGDWYARMVWSRLQAGRAAILLARRDAPLMLEIGNYYFGGGGYDLVSAERAYRRAVNADPKILWGHYQLARIRFVRGDYGGALDEIGKELSANPENLRSLYVRGLIDGARGNVAAAEDDFRRFVAWAPKEWAGHNDLAWVLQKQGKYREAEEVLQRAFRDVPNAARNPWLWNSLGVAELNVGKLEAAKNAFERAQELAGGLSRADWRAAYPGNDPATGEDGLGTFQEAIRANRERTMLWISKLDKYRE